MSCQRTVIIIPSRYGSTRFPGKPLFEIAGKSMIERVYSLAASVDNVDGVYVATDDNRIKEHVEGFGGQAIMTPEECKNGTERCYAAIQEMDERSDIIVNFQGDSPIMPPAVIQPVVDCLLNEADVTLATPAVRFSPEMYEHFMNTAAAGKIGGTCVVFDNAHNALYFSKNPIPKVRKMPEDAKEGNSIPMFKHLGLYGYRYETLEGYLKLPEGRLEALEGLEQLRALENGIPIRVVPVELEGRTIQGVDNPEDAKQVEAIIAKEGELL